MVIEFKRESKRNTGKKTGTITGGLEPEQIAYLQAISPYAFVRVCYSEDDAMKALRYYMSLGGSLLPGMPEREVEIRSVQSILGRYEEDGI